MSAAEEIDPVQVAEAAAREALRQCCERLEARKFGEIGPFLAGERLRDTPIFVQMQAVSGVCASTIASAVAPIAAHQREAAALTMLKGIGEMVRLALTKEQSVTGADAETDGGNSGAAVARAGKNGGEHAH